MTTQFRAFLSLALESPKKPRFAAEVADELGIYLSVASRYLREMEAMQWMASCLELEPRGGSGQRRRRMYLLTDYGIREATAVVNPPLPASAARRSARR